MYRKVLVCMLLIFAISVVVSAQGRKVDDPSNRYLLAEDVLKDKSKNIRVSYEPVYKPAGQNRVFDFIDDSRKMYETYWVYMKPAVPSVGEEQVMYKGEPLMVADKTFDITYTDMVPKTDIEKKTVKAVVVTDRKEEVERKTIEEKSFVPKQR